HEFFGSLKVDLGGRELDAGVVHLTFRVHAGRGERGPGIGREQREKLKDRITLLDPRAGPRDAPVRGLERAVERGRYEDRVPRRGGHLTAESPRPRHDLLLNFGRLDAQALFRIVSERYDEEVLLLEHCRWRLGLGRFFLLPRQSKGRPSEGNKRGDGRGDEDPGE